MTRKKDTYPQIQEQMFDWRDKYPQQLQPSRDSAHKFLRGKLPELPANIVDACIDTVIDSITTLSTDEVSLYAHRLNKTQHESEQKIASLADALLKEICSATPDTQFELTGLCELPSALGALDRISKALSGRPAPEQLNVDKNPTSRESEAYLAIGKALAAHTKLKRRPMAAVIAELFVVAGLKPSDTPLDKLTNTINQTLRNANL